MCVLINPFGAPEPLPILNPVNFVPKNGFPVVKGLRVEVCDFHIYFIASIMGSKHVPFGILNSCVKLSALLLLL